MIVGHIVSGPIDALIEIALPVALFAALWWWSARKERQRKDKEKK